MTLDLYPDCMLGCYALHVMRNARLVHIRHISRFLLKGCDAELQKLQRLL